jgi:hypothetical protein
MLLLGVLAACPLLAACGGKTELFERTTTVDVGGGTGAHVAPPIGFPSLATKNTTRVDGADPTADAAAVALAVYPSAVPGSYPPAVVLAPTDDWEAALASAVLMAAPIRAPILLSGSSSLPVATAKTLRMLAPKGSGAIDGVQLIRVGDVPSINGLHTDSIKGSNPYQLTAAIARFQTATVGTPSPDVVIASSDQPAYAMPAAGWAAESGDPLLFVSANGIPGPTRQALLAQQHPHIYVLGPKSAISSSVMTELAQFGSVKRVGGRASDPVSSSVLFAGYRDPPCVNLQPCAHVPGSFGWALRSPGHGYTLINAGHTLDAAAAAPLSASGSYGPELLVNTASALPTPVVNFFLDYATPAYTQEGPTAAVYNHGWVIGNQQAISLSAQAEMDTLLEAVPQK